MTFTVRNVLTCVATIPFAISVACAGTISAEALLSVSGAHLGMPTRELAKKGFRSTYFQGETYYEKKFGERDLRSYKPDLAYVSAQAFSLSGEGKVYWLSLTAEWLKTNRSNTDSCIQFSKDFSNLLYGNSAGNTETRSRTQPLVGEAVEQIEVFYEYHMVFPAFSVKADILCAERASPDGRVLRANATITDTRIERSKIADEISLDARLRLGPEIR